MCDTPVLTTPTAMSHGDSIKPIGVNKHCHLTELRRGLQPEYDCHTPVGTINQWPPVEM